MCHHSGPVTLDSLSDALPEIFFALKLRGEVNTLEAELEVCEPTNSRQCWFLGEKVRYRE